MTEDNELQQNILGTLCYVPQCQVDSMARLKPEYFTGINHAIFLVISQMYAEGKTVDVVTVAQETKDKGLGITFLTTRDIPSVTAATMSTLIDALEKKYHLRQLRQLSDYIQDNDEPQEIIEQIEQTVYKVQTGQKLSIVSPKEHATRMLNTLEKRVNRKSNGGICTTYADLNRALNGGFEPGQLIIIAAQTGKGKTAFTMNLMKDISITQKIPALYINTEMSEEQMDIRWLTLLCQIDHYRVATGQVSDEEYQVIMQSLEQMNAGGFHSITEPGLTLNKLTTICRRYVKQKGCKVVVIDYIGRMETLDPKLQEHQVLVAAAKRIKTIAQELGITAIMLAQVTEEEKLAGAKAMKNECDLYGYLRPLTDKESQQLPGFNYCLDVDKNRSGPTKKIPLTFYGEILTFKGGTNALANGQPQTERNNKSSPSERVLHQNSSKRRSQYRPYED
jgi:replicative DNA helicase